MPNCSLLVGEETPCDPLEIIDMLPPELVKFRIRKIVETDHARNNGVQEVHGDRIKDVIARFERCGYEISEAGIPTPTELKHGLASNVTRHKSLRGDFGKGVWNVGGDGFEAINVQALEDNKKLAFD